MLDFEIRHPGIAQQKIWKLFVQKAEEESGRELITAVEEVCGDALTLANDINRLFPNYTIHGESHSASVCEWMGVLLGDRVQELTVQEAAMLVMAACCHDIGMSVSVEQEDKMRNPKNRIWKEHFLRNPYDEIEFREHGKITDRILRGYVRQHHHERVEKHDLKWPQILNDAGITFGDLLELCRSHGTGLSRDKLKYKKEKYDLLLCAVLLRLADLLDYDISRSPQVLFRHMGLDHPRSAEEEQSAVEYLKNQAGEFEKHVVGNAIRYTATYDHPEKEQKVRRYLDLVEKELGYCGEELSQTASHWQTLSLPWRIDDTDVIRQGYTAKKFCMTMDQDRILDLLTGENLYSDPGVFVRELLQNSIDAVLLRAKRDAAFSLEQGEIKIETWIDDSANMWFCIRDNGTGMDEHIIENHFLKVGNSYYTSERFHHENRMDSKNSYSAISRFGIGILSCFMGDKEHTQLKVSTRRYGKDEDNGIRLDVTGLHGYYFLCRENELSDDKRWFPKMPKSPYSEEQGYREEPGTTICVNVNLIRMGDLRSIREILDKYVQFPEVRVTYNGPEGYKQYHTQQELMAAVYALNPDGGVKEYVHELSDEMYMTLGSRNRRLLQNKKPELVLRYHPVNWLSDSDKMTGVVISVSTRGSVPKVTAAARIADAGTIDMIITPWIGGYPDQPYTIKMKVSASEQTLWSMCAENIPQNQSTMCWIAYNGVYSDFNNLDNPGVWWFPDEDKAFSILLLHQDFAPQVNVARNKVVSLTLETLCCMNSVMRLWKKGNLPGYMTNNDYLLATERELWNILEKHPAWKDCLDACEEVYLKHYESRYFVWMLLQVAAWKKKSGVRWCWKTSEEVQEKDGENRAEYGAHRDEIFLKKDEEPSDYETADFPVLMFVSIDSTMDWQYTYYGHFVSYNRTAPLSRWLIEKREMLVQRVPDVYDQLIRNMVLKSPEKSIPQAVNAILSYLRSFDHNAFEIHDGLFLH